MNCDSELLQTYLDDQLEDAAIRELAAHLAGCRSCRRELSRLKLLWLELAPREEISLPPEWPYLRQQVMAAALQAQTGPEEKGAGFWETQRLAWQAVGLTTAYIPGTAGAVSLAKAAGRKLPGLLFNVAGRLRRRGRGREEARSR